jgi:hypothetical protein
MNGIEPATYALRTQGCTNAFEFRPKIGLIAPDKVQ